MIFYVSLHYIALHCITLHSTIFHYIALYDYIALITLHDIAVHAWYLYIYIYRYRYIHILIHTYIAQFPDPPFHPLSPFITLVFRQRTDWRFHHAAPIEAWLPMSYAPVIKHGHGQSPRHEILTGWCYTNPSEKYEIQLGWLFPICGK